MVNTKVVSEVRPAPFPKGRRRELILSAAYEEMLYYHLQSIRRLKYAIAFLFGFWTCTLFVEIHPWLACP